MLAVANRNNAMYIGAVMVFKYKPVQVFYWLHDQRFDILMKPVTFTVACALFVVTVGSTRHNYYEPEWKDF